MTGVGLRDNALRRCLILLRAVDLTWTLAREFVVDLALSTELKHRRRSPSTAVKAATRAPKTLGSYQSRSEKKESEF